jgi:Fe-S-cluster containining protein
MLVSGADIRLLEKSGYAKERFVQRSIQGFAQLRNRKGYCVFHSDAGHRCRVYNVRPLGCRIYPVIYSEEEGVIVDYLCPQWDTVSRKEVATKAKKLMALLKKIDDEAMKPRPQF